MDSLLINLMKQNKYPKTLLTAFLGAQGDIWDAQKDMLVGIIGSLIALILIKLNCKGK